MATSILQLYRLLEQGGSYTPKQLAAHLNLTESRVRRLLKELPAEEGIAVERREQGKTHAYFLKEETRLRSFPPIKLTDEQTLALAVGLRAAHAMLGSTPLNKPLQEALARITTHFKDRIHFVDLDQQQDRWYFGAIAKNDIDPQVFEILLTAVEHQATVRFQYTKPREDAETRTINPLCFAVDGNAIMLIGYCHKQEDLRDFALTRIAEAVLPTPPQHFDRPADFSPTAYFEKRFGALAGEDAQVVRILASPEVAHLFFEREYHPSQDIEHTEDDGSLQVSFEFGGLSAFRSFAQSWGHRIEVLEPATLRETLKEEAEAVLRRYADDALSDA